MAVPWVTMGKNRSLGGTCAPALQAALLAAGMGTKLRSLGMYVCLHRSLAGVTLGALVLVGLVLNDLVLNRRGRSLAAVA